MKLTRKSSPKAAPAPSLDPSAIAPVQGSFDLSDNAFGRAERVRHILMGVSLFTAAALTGIVILGLYDASTTVSYKDKTAAAEASTAAAEEKLAVLDQAGGYPADLLRQHITPRQAAFVSAITGEVDYVKVVQQAQTAASAAGLQLQSVTFTSTSSAPPATEDPEDPAQEAAPPKQVVQATIVATGPTTAGPVIQDAIKRIPGFSEVSSTFTNAEDATTYTVVVNITDEVDLSLFTQRYVLSLDQGPDGLPKAGTASATAPGTPPGTDPGSAPVVPVSPVQPVVPVDVPADLPPANETTQQGTQ